MNYLTQIIKSSSETETFVLKKKYLEVEKNINSLNDEVLNYLESNHNKFVILSQESQLSSKAENVTVEIDQLINGLKTRLKCELESAVRESENLSMKLCETSLSLCIVERLLDINSLINAAQNDQNQYHYLEAAIKFKRLQEILTSDVHIRNLNIYESLADRTSSLHSEFLNVNLSTWNKFISWEESTLPNNTKTTILILSNIDGKSDMVRVLQYYDYLDYQVTLLSRKLFNKLLEPIMNYRKYKTNLRIHSDESISKMTLEFEKIDDSNSDCSGNINSLRNIFITLFASLRIFIRRDETLINKLGESLESEFCDTFNKHFVYESIPLRRKEFPEFEKILPQIESLELFLKENGFLQPGNSVISDYIQNKDNAFIQKMCQTLLINARQILRQDLHDMIQITTSSVDEKKSKSFPNDNGTSICENFWKLPTCCISKSTQQLLTLIKDGLSEITPDNEIYNNIRIFNTLRDMISMYLDITPLVHEDLLKSLPQQAALFYNNCMYLAHELKKLNVEVSNLLSDKVITTFVDFVQPLESEGNKILNAQIYFQKQQLQEILGNSGLTNLIEYSEFPPSIEKSVAQCFRQLSLLQSVWQNILPIGIYNKFIGILCDVFLDFLIESILQFSDITVDSATRLANIFTHIQDKITDLLQDPKEIYRNVKLWLKFNEIIFVLNGSLKQIEDRWADGKGPLAQEFSSAQLKHLIRALFQHTDRRSALLSKIK